MPRGDKFCQLQNLATEFFFLLEGGGGRGKMKRQSSDSNLSYKPPKTSFESHIVQDFPNLFTAFTAMMLERKIIVRSSDISFLTPVCESLVSLLFPLSWCHSYIPVLPDTQSAIISSSDAPFLVGVGTLKGITVPDDVKREGERRGGEQDFVKENYVFFYSMCYISPKESINVLV